jgi:hypothetical protein
MAAPATPEQTRGGRHMTDLGLLALLAVCVAWIAAAVVSEWRR